MYSTFCIIAGMSEKSKEQVCLEIFVSSTISTCFKVPSFNTGNYTLTYPNDYKLEVFTVHVVYSVRLGIMLSLIIIMKFPVSLRS